MSFREETFVNSKGSLPGISHFAVLEYGTINHEGDERSRTNPGHGYPAYSENTVKYIAFINEEALKEYIASNNKYFKSYDVIYVNPVNIKTELKVTLTGL